MTRSLDLMSSGPPSAIFSPRSSTVMRSETRMTTLMSCSMSRIETLLLVPHPVHELGEHGRLARVHAGGRLVEQQHRRPQGQRPGDLQPALVAVGEVAGVLPGRLADADEVEQLQRVVVRLPLLPALPRRYAGWC